MLGFGGTVMAVAASTRQQSKSLVLTAMIFAVAMTFIDQTIVSIGATTVQKDLGLSSSGIQWAINAYLLALAALFAFGGRLADTVGHRTMCVVGVIVFAVSSALCGATPSGGAAEAWLITFRAIQRAGGASMFPAAPRIGPIACGYLIEGPWRSIFWINVPVAIIALILIAIAKPVTEHRPAPIDYRGLVLIGGGVGLSVFGFQQSELWGWGNPAVEICIPVRVVLLVVFYMVERPTENPLMNVNIFRNQPFFVENIILLICMMAFIPVFFFASTYGQIALGEKPTTSSLLILYFFIGFVVAAQIGGRMLDRIGAKRPVVLGSVLAAVGYFLWAGQVTGLKAGSQTIWIILAGAGMGLMLGQANTDAINRASRFSYGEATGITQTARHYGASLGFAILGTVLISDFRSSITNSLTARGVAGPPAAAPGGKTAQLQGGSGSVSSIPQFIRADFASATQSVLTGMGVIMAVCAVVAFVGLKAGIQQAAPAEATAERPSATSPADLRD